VVVVDCHLSWNALRQEGEKGRRKGVRVMMTSWKGVWLWPEGVNHPRYQHHSLPAVGASTPPPVPAQLRGGHIRLRCPLPSSPASQRYTFLALQAVPKPSLTIPELGGARPL